MKILFQNSLLVNRVTNQDFEDEEEDNANIKI